LLKALRGGSRDFTGRATKLGCRLRLACWGGGVRSSAREGGGSGGDGRRNWLGKEAAAAASPAATAAAQNCGVKGMGDVFLIPGSWIGGWLAVLLAGGSVEGETWLLPGRRAMVLIVVVLLLLMRRQPRNDGQGLPASLRLGLLENALGRG